MKRAIIIAASVLFVLLILAVIGGGILYYWMSRPLYRPGMVRAGENLRAPLAPLFRRAPPVLPPTQSGAQETDEADGRLTAWE